MYVCVCVCVCMCVNECAFIRYGCMLGVCREGWFSSHTHARTLRLVLWFASPSSLLVSRATNTHTTTRIVPRSPSLVLSPFLRVASVRHFQSTILGRSRQTGSPGCVYHLDQASETPGTPAARRIPRALLRSLLSVHCTCVARCCRCCISLFSGLYFYGVVVV
jgi:hypothetical protein